MSKYNADQYGNTFTTSHAVGTMMEDELTPCPDYATARQVAMQKCTATDNRTTVYGPGVGQILATFTWDSWANEAREQV